MCARLLNICLLSSNKKNTIFEHVKYRRSIHESPKAIQAIEEGNATNTNIDIASTKERKQVTTRDDPSKQNMTAEIWETRAIPLVIVMTCLGIYSTNTTKEFSGLDQELHIVHRVSTDKVKLLNVMEWERKSEWKYERTPPSTSSLKTI